MIPQPQPQRLRPLQIVCAGSPALALLLVWEIAFFLVFDGRLLDRRRVDLREPHDACLFILS